MKQVYLLIGGNLGNRVQSLYAAALHIQNRCGIIQQKSELYQTAAWGGIQQNDFLNQVLEIHTSLTAADLLETILAIEIEMGRQRDVRNGPRTIDIDILFYSNEIIDQPGLQVPHPRIAERRFVLVPLNEIAPKFIHPILHKTVGELLSECKDELPVNKYFTIVNNKG